MIEKLTRNEPVVGKGGTLTNRAYLFFSLLAENDIIIGTGTPEGNVSAKQGRLFMDENGSSGSVLYIKRDSDVSGDRSKGWIAV